MGRSEVGSAKYQSKQLKASGLQKLKFYCQICEKQCRDANGFKNHLNAHSHMGRIEELANSNKNVVTEYSNQFQQDFLRLLKIQHGTKAINANKFYQEYILNDKNHIHMNSTKWNSLTLFIKHLGQNGLVKVAQESAEDGNEFSLTVKLIESSKQDSSAGSSQINEEKSRMKFINNQIELGKQKELEHSSNGEILKQDTKQDIFKPDEPVKPIRLNLKKGPKKVTKPSIFE